MMVQGPESIFRAPGEFSEWLPVFLLESVETGTFFYIGNFSLTV